MGDREGMGGRGRTLDFQLSGRTPKGKRRGTGWRIWREDAALSLRRVK